MRKILKPVVRAHWRPCPLKAPHSGARGTSDARSDPGALRLTGTRTSARGCRRFISHAVLQHQAVFVEDEDDTVCFLPW